MGDDNDVVEAINVVVGDDNEVVVDIRVTAPLKAMRDVAAFTLQPAGSNRLVTSLMIMICCLNDHVHPPLPWYRCLQGSTTWLTERPGGFSPPI